MATKFDSKQAITPLIWKISWCRLHLVGGYSWVGYWMTPDKFCHDQPRCHGNEI